MPDFQDRTLRCSDCGSDFVFTAGEQQFYHDKGLSNEPRRCKACRGQRQSAPMARRKVETSAVCSQCGRATTVPFKPTQGRPIFCRECFAGRKAQLAAGAGAA